MSHTWVPFRFPFPAQHFPLPEPWAPTCPGSNFSGFPVVFSLWEDHRLLADRDTTFSPRARKGTVDISACGDPDVSQGNILKRGRKCVVHISPYLPRYSPSMEIATDPTFCKEYPAKCHGKLVTVLLESMSSETQPRVGVLVNNPDDLACPRNVGRWARQFIKGEHLKTPPRPKHTPQPVAKCQEPDASVTSNPN